MTMRKIDGAHPFMLTIERMLAMHGRMTPDELDALAVWERANVGFEGASLGTSDWPGWAAIVQRLAH